MRLGNHHPRQLSLHPDMGFDLDALGVLESADMNRANPRPGRVPGEKSGAARRAKPGLQHVARIRRALPGCGRAAGQLDTLRRNVHQRSERARRKPLALGAMTRVCDVGRCAHGVAAFATLTASVRRYLQHWIFPIAPSHSRGRPLHAGRGMKRSVPGQPQRRPLRRIFLRGGKICCSKVSAVTHFLTRRKLIFQTA